MAWHLYGKGASRLLGKLIGCHRKACQTGPCGRSFARYRLDGDKKLLQLIKKEHQDQLLKVAGEITSNSTAVERRKTMGKLTVYATDGRPEQTRIS